MKLAASVGMIVLSVSAWGQAGQGISASPAVSNTPPEKILSVTNQTTVTIQQIEAIRLDCIKKRRFICGKILNVLPNGLVVDSGYTDLLRTPLNESWLVPGTASANRPPNLVEGDVPDCAAVGLIFLTNLPKSRDLKLKLYDYVAVEGYPAGHYTYASVGEVKRTIRQFTTTLPKAVQLTVQAGEYQKPVQAAP